jgi:hypothetical protein
VERLDHEAGAIGSVNAVASALDVIGGLAERVRQGEFTPPRRSSIPVSAPVSRDPPTPSGTRPAAPGKITLSPAEREIARNSFGPIKGENGEMIDLTNAQKEFLYAKNKSRMLKARADGSLNE